MSPREQLALIFEAGLSTAKEVTAISGRGVGMDVVRSNIERIGGIVEVDSTVGVGTRMTLRVPLTLTIIPALTVSVAGQSFAIPRSAIDEIVRANGESVILEKVGGAGVATIRGRRVPEIALSDVLGLHSEIPEQDRSLVVLRPAGGDVYALAVDRIHDHEELVVKPAAPAVMATGLYAGTTLADDGSPILLFDPAGIAQVGGIKLETYERASRIAEAPVCESANETPVLLFRGLDGAPARAAPRHRRSHRGSARGGDPPGRRPAARPAWRGHPAAGGRQRRPAGRKGPPVPPQRWPSRDRLRLPRSRRPFNCRQRGHSGDVAR